MGAMFHQLLHLGQRLQKQHYKIMAKVLKKLMKINYTRVRYDLPLGSIASRRGAEFCPCSNSQIFSLQLRC
jgi:hypothetical protein